MRYLVKIQTNATFRNTFGQGYDISEPIKTLKEAKQYASLVDESVRKAHVLDMVTGKIVEVWK